MIKKIQANFLQSLGLALLLLTSFYFYRFSFFAVPNFYFILVELGKIFIFIFFLILIFLSINETRFKKSLNILFLLFISIFLLKLLFNMSGNISLHFFLKIIFANLFDFQINGKIPMYVKILSYLTPFIFIFSILLLLNKKLEKLKNFFVIFGFCLSIIMFWDLFKIFDKKYNFFDQEEVRIKDKKLFKKINQIENQNKKLLWLVFDGLDPEYVDLEVNEEKIFRNINKLKSNGVFHSNMFPPSNWTLYSVPAQLMGINIKNMIPKHDTLIYQTLKNNYVPFNFENTLFGNIHDLNLDVSLLSGVIEYCTAYLISQKWRHCEDINSANEPNIIFKESLKFYFSIFYKFRIYLNELGIIKIEEKSDSLIDVKLKPDLKKIELDSNNLEKIYNINFKNNFSADHTNIININKIIKNFKDTNLMYVNIYNPHLYNDSDIYIKNNLNYNIDLDKYLLKYLYTDLFIGKLLSEIKKDNYDDLLFIISSDHWNRDKDVSNKPKNLEGNYIGNSFFLAKILGDNDMFFIEKASSNLVVKNLIEKFFLGEINSNEDVNNLIINNKIKINTLINDEKTLD